MLVLRAAAGHRFIEPRSRNTIRAMHIGILGSGHIGATAARLFLAAGHHVTLANSRGPETLRDLVSELGPNAAAGTAEEAAKGADVVLIAVPLKEYVNLPKGELRGKIAIDAMNYYPNRDGKISSLDRGERTSSELVAAHLEGTRLVKAFNTIWFEHLKTKGDTSKPLEERRIIPISGDDAEAKQVVAGLVEELGFAPYDMGSLKDSALQQPDTPIYNNDVTLREAREIL
jgi:predicted dinucleotide-binding enzyme